MRSICIQLHERQPGQVSARGNRQRAQLSHARGQFEDGAGGEIYLLLLAVSRNSKGVTAYLDGKLA